MFEFFSSQSLNNWSPVKVKLHDPDLGLLHSLFRLGLIFQYIIFDVLMEFFKAYLQRVELNVMEVLLHKNIDI